MKELFGSREGTCQCRACLEVQSIGAYEVTTPMSLRELGLIALGCLLACFAALYAGLWLLDLI